MSESEYICLSGCSSTLTENELHQCDNCNKYHCPYCGGKVLTNEEYDENMRLNNEN